MSKSYTLLSVTTELNVTIQGRIQTVQLSVEHAIGIDQHYFVTAITETSFDLCMPVQGYFKNSIPIINTRLRSEFSIANEMLSVLDEYAAAIKRDASEFIVYDTIVTGLISGTECYFNTNGLHFIPASNIHSKQSGEVLSWYTHDVFTQGSIEISVSRNSHGQLHFEADETKLYDKAKLQALYNSDAFQNSRLAFFKYNELRRLLGIPVIGHPQRMSGLLSQGYQE